MNFAALRAVFVALSVLTGCSQPAVKSPASDDRSPPEASASAVLPADSWCLPVVELNQEPRAAGEVKRRYQHWLLCDYDRTRALRYLDILVARNDPWALREKGVLIMASDPAAGRRFIERSAALGYSSAQRTLDAMDSTSESRP